MSTHIMISILIELMQNDKVTAQRLAVKYEVSARSIYRYVDALSAIGIPVITVPGRNGGISLMQKYEVKSMFFTSQDLSLLSELLQRCPDKNANCLLQKIDYLYAHSS